MEKLDANGEIRGTGSEGIITIHGNMSAPNGTVDGKIGNFQTLNVNNKNILTEIDNLRSELRSERDHLLDKISDLKEKYKNHTHYLRMVKLKVEIFGSSSPHPIVEKVQIVISYQSPSGSN